MHLAKGPCKRSELIPSLRHGSRMAVGSRKGPVPSTCISASCSSGNVNIYDYGGGTSWSLVGNTIENTGGHRLDEFGNSVSLSSDGSRVAVGIPRKSRSSTSSDPPGAAKVYELSGSSWTQMGSDINGEFNADDFGRVWRAETHSGTPFTFTP